MMSGGTGAGRGEGVPGLMSRGPRPGAHTVLSDASWVMATWIPPSVNRQTETSSAGGKNSIELNC